MVPKYKNVLKIAKAIHPCIDSLGFLDWICRHNLQFVFFGVMRFGFSPLLLRKVASHTAPLEERSRLNTLVTSYLRAGVTVKTTGKFRTQHADRYVLQASSYCEQPRILEVGVSDGSSTIGLLEQKNQFSEITLSDRYPSYYLKPFPLGYRFYDADGKTHGGKWLGILVTPLEQKQASIEGLEKVESINPALRELHGVTSIDYFDVFTSRYELGYHVIKCSNLLNLVYFSESAIREALVNLCRSLKEGGYLVISHNNVKYKDGEAALLLQYREKSLHLCEQINDHELLSVSNLFLR